MENQIKKVEELKKVALPLMEFLNKYYDPHTYAVVNEGKVEIVCGQMTANLPIRD